MLVKFRDQEFNVSPVEYAGIDWGNTAEDFVRFDTVGGAHVVISLRSVAVIQVVGHHAISAPDPRYSVNVAYESGFHVDQAVRDYIIAALQGPGSEDQVLEFASVEGDDIKLITANITVISIIDAALAEL